MLNALIIEDDEAQQMLYCHVLKKEGFDIISAYNGEEGIEYLRTHPYPHLIVLDIRMPKVNGIEVLEFLTTHPDIDKIHVVIATALVTKESSKYQEILPSIDYLLKPHVLRDIRKIIDDMQARA